MHSHKMLMIFVYALAIGRACAQPPGGGTETINSVSHVRPGHEAEYATLSAETWNVYKRLDLVLDSPHVVLRGADRNDKPFSVEVVTWKSSDIPDHASPAVKAIWHELENVCEARDGRPGIDFSEVTVLALK